MPTEPRFIVAEVSKNWVRGKPISGSPLLSQSFEEIVNHWDQQGYKLHSFDVHRLVGPRGDELNETIIAVFERRDNA